MPIITSNPFTHADQNLEARNATKVILVAWSVVEAEVRETAQALGVEVVQGDAESTLKNIWNKPSVTIAPEVLTHFGTLQSQYDDVLKTNYEISLEHAASYLVQAKNVAHVLAGLRERVI